MPNMMAGGDIRRIRTALGLSVAQFATVLAVHPTTVGRWESSGTRPVVIEGVAWNVLMALRQRLGDGTDARVAKLGDDVAQALLVGGALVALAMLLKYVLDQ
jgi:transcriptional regulator with XRE-family HTH domain